MRRKVLLQLVVPLLSLCVLFFLLASEPAGGDRPQELVQLSVIFREESPVWDTARDGMEQAAADLGAELRFLTPAVSNDAEEQRALLERELQGGAQGILLIPADRETLTPTVRDTNRVVVTLETELEDADACVSVDNAALGKALAETAMNGVSQGSTVVLLDTVPGDNGVRERLVAARRALEKEGRRVVQLLPTEDQRVLDRLENMVLRTKPAAVLAFEPSALEEASALIRTMEAEDLLRYSGSPLLYGVGATPAIAAGLEQNRITAIHTQDEFSAGYMAVVRVIRTVRHQSVPVPEPVPFLQVRRENMYDRDRQKLMFPVTP